MRGFLELGRGLYVMEYVVGEGDIDRPHGRLPLRCALVDGALWLTNRRAPLMSDLDTAGMLGIILLVMLEGMYMRVLGVRAWARLGAAACSVTLFAALPAPWSKLGQPHEALGLACAHAVGELAIWAVERRRAGGHEKTA